MPNRHREVFKITSSVEEKSGDHITRVRVVYI